MSEQAGKSNKRPPRIVGFVCNWGAYSGVEMAGVRQTAYPAGIRLVRLACVGRLHTGLILKAFELGANGVVLLGCPEEACHYESGIKKAKEMFAQAKKLLQMLGIEPKRLEMIEVPVGRDDILVRRLSAFVKRVGGDTQKSGRELAEERKKEVAGVRSR